MKGALMTQVKTQSKVLALVLTMAMAIAMSLALAPSAFALDFNEDVAITADGLNGVVVNTNTTPYTYTIVGESDPNYVESLNGQYVHVELAFADADLDLSDLSAADATDYFQHHVKIAGRAIDNTSANFDPYDRDVFGTIVDDDNKTISFNIAYNKVGLTANFNGRLVITADSNTIIGDALGQDTETLIHNGVTLASNTGIAVDAEGQNLEPGNGLARQFTISTPSHNRGMIHILVLDGNTAVFYGNGTFSEGGFTIHAHDFLNQTPADFASSLCTTANNLNSGYTFTSGSNGSFTISHGSTSCSNVKVYIYDCDYLNDHHCSIGTISEAEWPNN